MYAELNHALVFTVAASSVIILIMMSVANFEKRYPILTIFVVISLIATIISGAVFVNHIADQPIPTYLNVQKVGDKLVVTTKDNAPFYIQKKRDIFDIVGEKNGRYYVTNDGGKLYDIPKTDVTD